MTNYEKYKTADERASAFTKWCSEKQKTAIGKVAKHECSDCPLDEHTPCCFFFWLDIESEEEKPLPCPLCGARIEVHGALLKCTACGLRFIYGITTNESVNAFNRVSRAVIEQKEGGAK